MRQFWNECLWKCFEKTCTFDVELLSKQMLILYTVVVIIASGNNNKNWHWDKNPKHLFSNFKCLWGIIKNNVSVISDPRSIRFIHLWKHLYLAKQSIFLELSKFVCFHIWLIKQLFNALDLHSKNATKLFFCHFQAQEILPCNLAFALK